MSQVNKKAIASAFGRAAPYYDQFAGFQRQTGCWLLKQLNGQPFPRVLDAGCGTGYFSAYWHRRGSEVTALDLSCAMLEKASERQAATYYVLGDIENLPLATGRFTLCWSNLALQWCGELSRALNELYRVTAAGGWVAFSTLAQGSLTELHQASAVLDQHLHGNVYPDMQTIARASPTDNTRWYQQPFTLYFPDVLSLLRSLKGIGATHLQAGFHTQGLTRRHLQQLTLAWPRKYGYFPLTYQLVFGVLQHD